MVYNKPTDQTGCKELKRQVILDKINFSRAKGKIMQNLLFPTLRFTQQIVQVCGRRQSVVFLGEKTYKFG